MLYPNDFINAEYYDIDEIILQNTFDNGLVGFRNDITRLSRMLNLENKINLEIQSKINVNKIIN